MHTRGRDHEEIDQHRGDDRYDARQYQPKALAAAALAHRLLRGRRGGVRAPGIVRWLVRFVVRLVFHLAVDGVDDGVQHIGVGGEALLKILRQRLGVGKLHRLDRFVLRRGRHRLAVGHDGRHDGRVLHLIALDILHQLLPQLLRGLIAVLGLERAGLQENGG